ncbi:testis-expressed protein 19.2-like isoform X2 [Dipodomys merriami]|uniref:testis-expressed protein 19.2-like isoform X2 n=1 Tax=Dipodomys merriami TaxID=94247 RepID=UPI003855887A
MCPPVMERHGREGVSHLHALWVFRLLHGQPLQVCFACFKIAFLDLKDLLESEEWEEDDWDLDPLDSPEEEEEEEEEFEPVHPGAVALAAMGLQEVGLGYPYVPTELRPEDVVPLDAGPKDGDWIQGLPWRCLELPSCSHWPQNPPPWQWSLSLDQPPREPVVLELGTVWPVEPMEAEVWLLGLQFVCMESSGDTFYLRKMVPDSVLQPVSHRWKLLLDPDEACQLGFQDLPQYLDLPRWKLSILDTTVLDTQLVPADTMLLKKGFRIISCSPQSKGWDDPACTEGVVSVSRGQRAVMTCNISNPFTRITVSLSAPGADGTLFRVEPSAGRSRASRDGWELLVQGGRAQLVVESAQDRHAGLYSWRLRGHQLNNRNVSLNVSDGVSAEPEPGPAAPTPDPPAGSGTTRMGPETQPWLSVLCVILVLDSLGEDWRTRGWTRLVFIVQK